MQDGRTGCPHLWRVVWSEGKSLQIGLYLPTGDHLETPRRHCYARRSFPLSRGDRPALARQQELTAESLWLEVSDRLKGALNDTTFGTWFGDVSARELNDDAFVLSVPNDFTRDWIEGHFLDLIGAAVRDATGGEKEVSLFVEREVEPSGPVEDAPAVQTARRAFEMSQ